MGAPAAASTGGSHRPLRGGGSGEGGSWPPLLQGGLPAEGGGEGARAEREGSVGRSAVVVVGATGRVWTLPLLLLLLLLPLQLAAIDSAARPVPASMIREQMTATSLQGLSARPFFLGLLRREAEEEGGGEVGDRSGARVASPLRPLPRVLATTTAHAEATATRCAPATRSTTKAPRPCQPEGRSARKSSFAAAASASAPPCEPLVVARHAPAAAAKREKFASAAPQ